MQIITEKEKEEDTRLSWRECTRATPLFSPRNGRTHARARPDARTHT